MNSFFGHFSNVLRCYLALGAPGVVSTQTSASDHKRTLKIVDFIFQSCVEIHRPSLKSLGRNEKVKKDHHFSTTIKIII